MKNFHCSLHVAPTDLPELDNLTVESKSLLAYKLPRIETRFQRTFEEIAALVTQLPRFYFEPDGSFVWVVEKQVRFQLDGSLFDDGTSVLNVELKGTCDAKMLDEFLTCVGWPEEKILFQLVQQGGYLAEPVFREHFVSA